MAARDHATCSASDRAAHEAGALADLAPELLFATFMSSPWLWALFGGALIGVASALLLLTHGRIAGISGITGRLVLGAASDRAWRLAFLAGLIAAGAVTAVVVPHAIGAPVRSPLTIIVAGVLVGYGTQLGNGCTSGHGVCGLARFSSRALVAVVTFVTTGAITAMFMGRVS
jgi:uncharacterized protein